MHASETSHASECGPSSSTTNGMPYFFQQAQRGSPPLYPASSAAASGSSPNLLPSYAYSNGEATGAYTPTPSAGFSQPSYQITSEAVTATAVAAASVEFARCAPTQEMYANTATPSNGHAHEPFASYA